MARALPSGQRGHDKRSVHYQAMKLSNEVSADDMEAEEEDMPIHELVSQGKEALDLHQLREAEELFHQVLEKSSESSEKQYQHLVTTFIGLAELYVKRGRMMRHDEMEWHRMYIHAMSSKRKAIECCNLAMDSSDDNQTVSWFEEKKTKAENQLKTLEECVVKSLRERLIRKEKIDDQGVKDKLHLKWVENLQEYYVDKCASNRFLKWASRENLRFLEEEDEEEEVMEEPEEPKAKKINFDRVQKAIQKVVKRISQKHVKIHDKMTPEEKLTLVSPYSGEYSILKQFAKAFHDEEELTEDLSEDEFDENGLMSKESVTDERRRSSVASESEIANAVGDQDGELETVEEQMNGVDEEQSEEQKSPTDVTATWQYNLKGMERTVSFKITPVSPNKWQSLQQPAPPLPARVQTRTSTSTDMPSPKPTDEIKLPGVLTIWRAYNRESLAHVNNMHVTYKLQTYEEMSPLTEVLSKSSKKDVSTSSEDDENDLMESTPVSEVNLDITLAHVLSKMAEKLKKDNKLTQASELYQYALGILHKCSWNSALFTPVANIIQNIGMIKCMQGDFMGGSQLLEECIKLFEKSSDKDVDLNVAKAWYELGNAFMMEQWQESSLFDHIMRCVHEKLLDEWKQGLEDVPDDMSDDDTDSESGASYAICTQEAMNCYSNALAILRRIQVMEESHKKLYVNVLTKLGDCTLMGENYEHAVPLYEEALHMFKNIVGSASLEINAHVLSMLGTANFLLSNYAKAISMYECSHVIHQHIHGAEGATFGMAFSLTMVGISYRCMKYYHKCIVWCLKAFEIYTSLYKGDIAALEALQRWFVSETLYTLGFSYGTLNFSDKALQYLKLARNMVTSEDDVKQCVKILKAIADQLVSLEDNETALEYYNEALELSISLGDERSANALQNQLLNRMAGVHVSSKDYNTAAMYLKQALDYQKNVENTIKDDLVGILKQLGLTYTLAGDIDRAIECYTECIESYSDMTAGSRSSEMARILGSLGTLYHVKACIQEDNEHMMDLLLTAEKHYQDAVELDSNSSVCVQYANYLYQQAQCADALLTMLPLVHIHSKREDQQITYSGVEQAVLPEHLQQEVDDTDEVALKTKVFAKFLAVLCYKHINLRQDAEDCLVDLVRTVVNSKTALNHSILGYAMLEMNLFLEAAECFANAASLEHDNDLSITNYWLSVVTWIYSSIAKGLYNVYEYVYRDAVLHEWMANAADEAMVTARRLHAEAAAKAKDEDGTRDSGVYDRGSGEYYEQETEAEGATGWQSETVETPTAILQSIKSRQQGAMEDGHEREHFTDKGYYSSEYLERQGLDDGDVQFRRREHWQSEESMDTLSGVPEEEEITYYEEAVETPTAILELLRKQSIGEDQGDNYTSDSWHSDGGTQPGSESDHQDEWVVQEEEIETPMAILQALRDAQNEIVHMIRTVSTEGLLDDMDLTSIEKSADTESDEEQITITEEHGHGYVESGKEPEHIQEVYRSDEEEEEEERIWVTEEVVETPMAILRALASSQQDSRKVMPMEMSPDSETSTATSLSEPKHEEEEETIWVTEEVVETPTAILEAIRTSSSGAEQSHESFTGRYRHDASPWRREDHSRSSRYERTSDTMDSYHRTSHVSRPYVEAADIRNGNNLPQSSMSHGEEQEEEVWETIEETVETPPEIMQALLRAQQSR